MITLLCAQPLIQKKTDPLDRLNLRNRWLRPGLILVIMLVWSGFSWLIAQRYTVQMQDQSYQHQKHLAQQQLEVLNGSLHDVLTTLARRAPYARLILYPPLVPGAAATVQIVSAIESANRHAAADVLLLNKCDLLPYLEFDADLAEAQASLSAWRKARAALEQAMSGHVIEHSELVGTYQRRK